MREADVNWIAGLLEGEGCFTKRTKPGTIRSRVCIMCQMTDSDVLHKLCKIAGVGKVRGPYNNGPRGKLPRYTWQVNGSLAYVLMKELFPHMCSRRQARISKLVSEYESYAPKLYRFVYLPTSAITETETPSAWYKKNGLNESSMWRTMAGERNSCYGWKRLQ